MNSTTRTVTLVIVLIGIAVAISFLQGGKVSPGSSSTPVVEVSASGTGTSTPVALARIAAKAKLYEKAKEISTPDGFINTNNLPITLSQYVGKKVVILDIWTYSCINCIRTLPYLNDWYTKYEDKGLVIIGLHTPEFNFEKDINNVKEAVAKYGIKFPVVLDNDYSTWNAYKNLYWPRKYIIDIDGFIRYDHVGEGGYAETEAQIQELLKERADVLGTKVSFTAPITKGAEEITPDQQSQETYFGSARNAYFGNGTPGMSQEKNFAITGQVSLGKFYLNGMWNVQSEYAINTGTDASIVYPFVAGKVYLVASADAPTRVQILVDGESVGKNKGDDVVEADGIDTVTVKESRLYNLYSGTAGSDAHVLEVRALDKGLKAFTFTFGN